MADYIELMGCTGVGKTTLYRMLEQQWTEDCVWIPEARIYPTVEKKIDTKPSWYHLRTFAKYLSKRLVGADRYATINVPQPPDLKAARDEFVSLYPDSIKMFWENVSKRKPLLGLLDDRFYATDIVGRHIARIHYAKCMDQNRSIILDEALIHNLAFWIDEGSADSLRTQCENLLERIPLPQMVIFLDASEPHLLERYKSKKCSPQSHPKNLSDDTLLTWFAELRALAGLVLEVLKQLAVDVEVIYTDNLQDELPSLVFSLLNSKIIKVPSPTN